MKPDGSKQSVQAPIGDSMLEVAHANKIDIEGAFLRAHLAYLLTAAGPRARFTHASPPPPVHAGACGGETACSTCHLYIDAASFKKLPEVSEAEEDMLDLAAGLKPNSRLGCQVFAAENLDGMVVEMPKEVNNMKA